MVMMDEQRNVSQKLFLSAITSLVIFFFVPFLGEGGAGLKRTYFPLPA
jgi:hypothetical protein